MCSLTKTSLLFLVSIVKAVLEKERDNAVKETATLKASVTTLTAKVETLNKNIALQKETEKQLQVRKTVISAAAPRISTLLSSALTTTVTVF